MANYAPVPLVRWDQTDDEWRAERRNGCGASDVAALLGFSRWRTPWQVWAEKTGHPMAPVDDANEAARLGNLLEPWLLLQAIWLIQPSADWHVSPTPHRLYRHAEHPLRMCSPDGQRHPLVLEPDDDGRWDLVQAKTAGLQTGRAPGWSADTYPLGYELQARWEMHVMGAAVNHLVALVAGLGLVHHPIARDMEIEENLVGQVAPWWERHVIGGDEPPLSGGDADMLAKLYPRVVREAVRLDDTDALSWWEAYRDAHADVTEAEARKSEAAVALKALIGDAKVGLVEGRAIATWSERRSRVDWEAMCRSLVETYGLAMPDPESYRGEPGRTFTIKE